MNEPFSPAPSSSPDSPSFETGKQHAIQAAEELRAAAGAKAQQLKEAAENRANQLKEVAGQRAHEIKDAAGQRASEIRDIAEQSLKEVRDRAEDWKTEGEKYVKENPTQAVVAALGIGFVLGLLVRR